MDFISVLEPLIRNHKIEPVEIEYTSSVDRNYNKYKIFMVHQGRYKFKGKTYICSDQSKKKLKMRIYEDIYKKIVEELPQGVQMLSSGSFQVTNSNIKRKSTSNADMRRKKMFVEKYNVPVNPCQNCKHQFNFWHCPRCQICGEELPKCHEQPLVFIDTERAAGPATSDPIQLGMVKYDLPERRIIDDVELNILPKQKIDKKCAEHSHGMFVKNQCLYRQRKGEKEATKVETITASEAIVKIEHFLRGCSTLVSHSALDYITLESWSERNKFQRGFLDRMGKIDSIPFYKHLMSKDFKSPKHGMAAITRHLALPHVRRTYEAGAHGAIVDARTLCSISTGNKIFDRFMDWVLSKKLH